MVIILNILDSKENKTKSFDEQICKEKCESG